MDWKGSIQFLTGSIIAESVQYMNSYGCHFPAVKENLGIKLQESEAISELCKNKVQQNFTQYNKYTHAHTVTYTGIKHK